VLPSEINVPHENDSLNPHEDHEVDSKDNSAGAEDHDWMVVDGFGEVNESRPSSGHQEILGDGFIVRSKFRIYPRG